MSKFKNHTLLALRLLIIISSAVLLLGSVNADTYTLQPDATAGIDTYYGSVYSPGPNDISTTLSYGGWGDWYYDYFKFDLSAAPSATETNSAQIQVYVTGGSVNNPAINIYRITQDWAENTLTRTLNPTSVLYGAGPVGPFTAGQWYSADITQLYKDWKNGVYTNYGLKFTPTNQNNTAGSFASSDDTDPTHRPKLVIDYTPATPIFDSVSSYKLNAVSSITWSHTVGSNLDRLLLVGTSNWANPEKPVTSVTYNGIALTKAGSIWGSTGGETVNIWYLVNPPSGTFNVVANFSSATSPVVGATSWSNVNQSAPLGAFVSNYHATGSTLATVNATSATNEIVHDVVSYGLTTTPNHTIGAGQTQRWSDASSDGSFASGAASTEPGASSVTMSWTLAGSYRWAIGAIPIRPVGSGAIPPTLSSPTATSVTNTTAILGANVTSNGGATLTARGTCWATTPAPTTNCLAEGGTTTGVFTHSRTGLPSNTLIYYRGYATNSAGTGYSTDGTFTTAAAPTVITNAASSITAASAALNGNGDPNLATTTGWFRYATTSPGTCNDTFGTRVPASGGSALGSGGSGVAYSQSASGLTPATTYYFCAIVSNAYGTAFGSVLSFITANPGPPTVTTSAATVITNSSATLNGSANPNTLSTTGWFRYATTSPGTCNDTFGTRVPASGGDALGSGSSAVAYDEPVSGLSANTTYYFCAIAQNSAGTAFGSILSLVTGENPWLWHANGNTTYAGTTTWTSVATIPAGQTKIAFSRYAMESEQTLTGDRGNYAVTFFSTTCTNDAGPWTGSSSPEFACTTITNLAADWTDTSGLTPDCQFRYVAATRSVELQDTVTAEDCGAAVFSYPLSVAPTVTTPTATSIISTGATLGANVTLDGGAAITARGTCWATTPAPTTNCLAEGGTTTGVFTHARTGMSAGTLIYYRGYATNSVGTSYSADGTFTTLALPTVTTPTATSITSTTATLGANVTSNGGETLTARGTCWATTPTPTTNCLAEGGTTTGVFTHGRSSLPTGTLIYYRGYAANSVGTAYSTDGSFTTLALPTVTTPTATAITSTSATLGANVTSNGGATLTARGTCWATTPAPTTNCLAEGGTTTGVFTHGRTSLPAGTLIYYRGYATNTVGTAYSTDGTFTTSVAAPTVTTPTATSITSVGATLGANVTSNGGATLTARGTCWGTSPAPTGNCLAEGGTTTGVFTHARTGMPFGTLIYYRGYATNSAGTSYSTDGSFTTLSVPAPTVTSINPFVGRNNGTVSNITVTGTGFNSASVKLTKSGQSDVNCTGTGSGTSITGVTCDITSKTVGAWSVVVTNADTQTGTLAGGFTISSMIIGGLISSTFDTGVTTGVNFNSILWQGILGTGGTTYVRFQLATSNCSNGASDYPACTSGTWVYFGASPTNQDLFYTPTGYSVPAAVSSKNHKNQRYYRYKLFLERADTATSPRVDDVIVNWSP